MTLRPSQGFTLIELLVVIAIIGILMSIVLVSLNSARGRASEARVRAHVRELRNVAELYYDEHDNYGTQNGFWNPGSYTLNNFCYDASAGRILAALAAEAGAVHCAVGLGAQNYTVNVELRASGGKAVCLDSTGNVTDLPNVNSIASSGDRCI